MKAAQFVLSETDILAVAGAAKRLKLSKSEIVRRALQLFFEVSKRERLEKKLIAGYVRTPQKITEIEAWENVQAWPED
jgi:hypothetical protein